MKITFDTDKLTYDNEISKSENLKFSTKNTPGYPNLIRVTVDGAEDELNDFVEENELRDCLIKN